MCNSGYTVRQFKCSGRFTHRVTHSSHLLFLSSSSLITFFWSHSLDQLSKSLFSNLLFLVELLLSDDFVEIINRIVSHHIFLARALNIENLDIKSVHISNGQSCRHKVFFDLSGTSGSRISSSCSGRSRCTCTIFRSNKVYWRIVPSTFQKRTCISTVSVLNWSTQNILEVGKRHLWRNNCCFRFLQRDLSCVRVLALLIGNIDIRVFETLFFFGFNLRYQNRGSL